MKHSEIAREAAALIAQAGHCKNHAVDELGRICYAGAVNAAAHGGVIWLHDGKMAWGEKERYAYSRIHSRSLALLAEQDVMCLTVPNWNDLPETSSEDVILLLKETAASLEEDGK